MIFEFVVSLSSLARVDDLTKCLFLNDEPCMVRPTIIAMNPMEFKYYPFMTRLNKCNVSYNVLYLNICVAKESKDIYVKAFNWITNKDETKAITEHISCDCKLKFNSPTCISNQKWNNKKCQCECKNFHQCKKRL